MTIQKTLNCSVPLYHAFFFQESPPNIEPTVELEENTDPDSQMFIGNTVKRF